MYISYLKILSGILAINVAMTSNFLAIMIASLFCDKFLKNDRRHQLCVKYVYKMNIFLSVAVCYSESQTWKQQMVFIKVVFFSIRKFHPIQGIKTFHSQL